MVTPAGRTVTILFTDQVGSTERMQEIGDDAADELRRAHFTLLRGAVDACGGHVVKNVGDGLMVVFDSAVDAVGCAVRMQRAVAEHNATHDAGMQLGLKAGLNIGEPVQEGDDYFGTPVNIAQRLCDAASGAQILVSDVLRGVLGSRGGYELREYADLRLKGIELPITVHEVVWSDTQTTAQRAAPPAPAELAEPALGFVGRRRECDALRTAWERACRGERRVVFVDGDAGAGKTSLVASIARTVGTGGARVVYARCEEQPLRPFEPIAVALAALPGGAQPAAQLMRGGADSAGAGFELATAALRRAARQAAVMLVVDDAHLADDDTLRLLRHLVRSPGDALVLVVVLFCHADVTSRHALSSMMLELRHDGLLDRLTIDGLDVEETRELAALWSGSDVPLEFARALHARTEGNPLFIQEVLRHMAETGAIYEEGGRLVIRSSIEEAGVPAAVKEVIRHRLARLSPDCERAVRAAAVTSREFDLSALEQLGCGVSGDRLLDALEQAVDARILSESATDPGRYAFAHRLVREAVFEDTSAARRISLLRGALQFATAPDGTRLAYEVLGTRGPYMLGVALSISPTVRMHVVTLTRRWQRIAEFARVVLYDRRGMGASDTPDRGYSAAATFEDIDAVLGAAGATRAIIWGATDGGPLAVRYAAEHPERVAALILLGTSARVRSTDDFPYGFNERQLGAFMRLTPVDQARATSELAHMRVRRFEDAHAIGEVIRRVPGPIWEKMLAGIATVDARPFLAQVRVPTLIIHDPENTYVPVEAAEYLHENIAGSRLFLTEDAANTAFGDELFARVRDFVEDVGVRAE
jgi:class 3 adenylate cyclase/pimeloyl-ACP methyl ester carboxylesterase